MLVFSSANLKIIRWLILTFKKIGILEQVKPKLVFGNNVRNVLAAIESGNADAGIVYTTDAKTSDKVRVVATATENLHSPIVYPIAVIGSSKNPDAAKEYIQFLTDKQAKSVFEKYDACSLLLLDLWCVSKNRWP